MAAHDRAFLEKIEQFLLHPAVRALSLAQRVDFLEQKGLSPEEITQCLKAVQAHNGLAQLVQGPASAALSAASTAVATDVSTSGGTTSKLALLTRMTRKYSAMALILSLLGVGYLRFRQRMTEQLVVEYLAERNKRRGKRNAQIGALLSVIQDQQAQYKQAASLLQHRVANVAKMQQDALAQQSTATAGAIEMRKRHEEVHRLKVTLLQLKREVMSAFAQPPRTSPVKPDRAVEAAESAKTMKPGVSTDRNGVQVNVAPAGKKLATVAVQAVCTVGTPSALKTTASQTVKTEKKTSSAAPDRIPMLVSRPVNVAELMGGQADNDELSTSQSYRLLSATS